jgi:8-amino-3,8-dideoxy-alpha-D-manno-octulosonate transaminase
MSELSGAMALAQLRKLKDITAAMREAKWKIRSALTDLKGLTFRRIIDPQGDSGPCLIFTFDDSRTCTHFMEALKAEGLKGPLGSLACLSMEEWGLHWYFNNPSLVHKRSISRDGFPWTHPANAFGCEYDYSRGALPCCDDLASRSGLLTIASCLTDDDVDDIIAAFRKVAAHLL